MVGANTLQTDASSLRKLRKPMVEKKRRDRMNVSIDNLKALLAKSSKNPASVVKMDKSEILELAVTHLSQLHHEPKSTGPNTSVSYRTGFRACTKETIRYLNSSALMPNPHLKALGHHLHNVCETTSHQSTSNMSSASLLPGRHCTSSPVLDSLPPMPRFSPFCGSNLFSPISSVETRGHVMQSPLDNGHVMQSPLDSVFFNSVSRSSSTCSTSSPSLSSCSFSASDNSASGLNVLCFDTDSDSSAECMDSKSDNVLGHMINDEKLWRPW